MIKVFLIVAAVILAGSAYLGIVNRATFVETRQDKDKINDEIKKEIESTDEKIVTLNEKYTKLTETHKERDLALAQRERYTERIEEQQTQLNTANQTKSELMTEKSEYDQVLADFKVKFPDIDSFEELAPKVEELKTQKADAETRQKELETAVAAMTNRVEKNTKTIKTFVERQADRSQGIALNGTEGTITAVNQDWGFAVINIGKNQGVSADSELIVKRGTEIVGKLSIVSIEPRLTVADIRMDTLKKGARILAGDRVIFEKLQD